MASLCRSVGRRGQWKAGWMKGLIGLTQAGRTQGRDLAGPRRLLPQPQAQQCQEASGPCPQLARESDILLIDPSHPGHSAHLLNSPAVPLSRSQRWHTRPAHLPAAKFPYPSRRGDLKRISRSRSSSFCGRPVPCPKVGKLFFLYPDCFSSLTDFLQIDLILPPELTPCLPQKASQEC